MEKIKPKIVLKHTRIEVNDYDLGDCPSLEYTFSIYDPMRHTTDVKVIEYDIEKRKLFLPRGIDISYLERMFNVTPMVDKKPDPYVNTDQIPIKYLTRDDRQSEILKFIIGEGKYQYTKSKSQLCVNTTTGSGKTFLTVAAMCYTGSRMIIITSAINWLEQWREKIFEYTPLLDKDVYMISGSVSVDRILCGDPLDYQVFLVSHSTIKSYGDKHGWERIDELFAHLQCGLKVYDEAHLYFDNMSRIDMHSNTRKTLYLTATPQRSHDEENAIYQLYFKNVPSISLFDPNSDPHVNYIAMHFNSHPTPLDIQACSNAYGFNRNAYVKYITSKEVYYKIVCILVDMMMNMDGKILVYIGMNEGVMKTYEYIVENFPFLERHVGVYTSIVDKEDKEYNLYKKIILSTTKSCGAAQDIADLKCTINLAEPFRSSVLARQTLGRCRADNTFYIDIVDNGFYFTKKYYKVKKPVFSQYAKTCKDVPLSDVEIEEQFLKVKKKYKEKKVMCMRVYKE